MGLLDKLWDDVLAGPQPDKGLGRLRKDKLSLDVDASGFDEDRRLMYERRRSGEFQYSQDEARRVTQSIDILKPPVLRSFGPDESLPSTPSGTSAPLSPSLASPRTWPLTTMGAMMSLQSLALVPKGSGKEGLLSSTNFNQERNKDFERGE
ncbi:hypothetical protein O6H91_09G013300 [Diphasiastrum complanatum]|uniref:Uncharacterized protein n=1 Tax=Diphasiastrum complanatum TaxID=34168 RepID=A0ACC2CLB7_DIPCM|nr:hypothetical protein O6H91_09G013300 [Diphasiastrum complanatum]